MINWDSWIEIFRTGDYGAKGRYSEADLDQIVRSYQPTVQEAPLTIGHPEHDKPAFGWVASLKRDGGKLLAQFSHVQQDFKEWVERGLYKTRSVTFYKDLKGGLALRHVGFLGAMPPEVKGLAALPVFSEQSGNTVEFNFQDRKGGIIMGLFDRLKSETEVVTSRDLEEAEKRIMARLGEVVMAGVKEGLGYSGKKYLDTLETELVNRVKDRIYEVQQGLLKQFEQDLREKLQKVLDEPQSFSEDQLSASKKFRKTVHFNESADAPVDVQSARIAEEAEDLAEEKGISYGEALTRVKEHYQNQEFQDNSAKTIEVAGHVLTVDPRNPFDPDSITRLERIEAISSDRGVSFAEAMRIEGEAQWVAKKRKLSFSEALEMV